MTCEACSTAAREPSHEFRDGCRGCAARSVSRGPNFWRCQQTGRRDWKYRDELALLGVSHEEVKAAAQADAARGSCAEERQ